MPMIDVYARTGTFADRHRLAVDLATTPMTIEGVPDISMTPPRSSTTLDAESVGNVEGRRMTCAVPVSGFTAPGSPSAGVR